MLYASVPIHFRHSYVILAGNPKQFPLCASRRSHVPTSVLCCTNMRPETWRPLPNHDSNSFAVLWYEYMSHSKFVTSVVFWSPELKPPPASPGQSRVRFVDKPHHSMNEKSCLPAAVIYCLQFFRSWNSLVVTRNDVLRSEVRCVMRHYSITSCLGISISKVLQVGLV